MSCGRILFVYAAQIIIFSVRVALQFSSSQTHKKISISIIIFQLFVVRWGDESELDARSLHLLLIIMQTHKMPALHINSNIYSTRGDVVGISDISADAIYSFF